MYIRTERHDAELTLDKISSKTELINEIKTLANTLLDELLHKHDITIDDITKEMLVYETDMQNIYKLDDIYIDTEKFLNNIEKDDPLEIQSDELPYYLLKIELDENSKLKISAGSEIDSSFSWDILIQWFSESETSKI